MTSQINKHIFVWLTGMVLCSGELYAQSVTTIQPGNWHDTQTWSNGIVPTDANTTEVIIQHNIFVISGTQVSINDLVIGQGSLTVETGAKIDIVPGPGEHGVTVGPNGSLYAYGVIVCHNGTSLAGTTAANTTFFDGSVYQHLSHNEGVIPVAEWYANSTFELSGLQNVGTVSMQSPNWSQSFGNFIYDNPSQGSFVNLNARLTEVKGDLVVRSTNGNILRFARGHTLTLNIGGDLRIEGASEVWFGESHNSRATVSIAGNFVFATSAVGSTYLAQRGISNFAVGGDLLINALSRMKMATQGDSGLLGRTTIQLLGDFILTRGTIDALGFGRGRIVFAKDGEQTFFRNPTGTVLEGNLDYIVESESILSLGESRLSNTISGDVIIEGKVIVGSVNPLGPFQSGMGGNIQVQGEVILQNGSSVEFVGGGAQFLGGSFSDYGNANIIVNNGHGITATNDISLGSLTIQQGNFNAGAHEISLTGNLTVGQSGSFTHSGTIIMNGSGEQVISAGNHLVRNLIVHSQNASNVTLTSPLSLSGHLSILSPGSDFISNGHLTLLSSSEAPQGTAGIGPLPSGSNIVGDVTVQRFMAGIGDTYRYISSAVSSATVASLMDDIAVTGTFDDPSTGPGLPSSSPSLFVYDEVAGGWQPYPTSGTAASNPLLPGKGYCIFNWNNTAPTLWDVSGIVNQSPVNFTLTFTDRNHDLDGWNLIGNPYPCAIRWGEQGWTRNNSVQAVIAVRDNSEEGRFLYSDDQGVGDLTDGLIASGQSFWVRATAPGPSLQINETAKHINGATFYRKRMPDYVELIVRGNNVEDHAFVRLREGAEKELDNYDAPKLINDKLSLSTLTADGTKVAINAFGQIPCRIEIPINLEYNTGEPSDLSLFVQPNGLFGGCKFYLFDQVTDTLHDLGEENPALTLVRNGDVFQTDRYSLIIESPTPEEVTVHAPDKVCSDEELLISLEGTQPGMTYMLYKDGVMYEYKSVAETSIFKIPSDSLSGTHTFQMVAGSTCSELRMPEIRVVKIVPEVPLVEGGFHCEEGPVTLRVFNPQEGMEYSWYESPSGEPVNQGIEYTTPLLIKSKTYFLSGKDSFGCRTDLVSARAEIIYPDEIVITEQDGYLVSSASTGNQWFLNDDLLPGETSAVILPALPGLYQTQVSFAGCMKQAQFHWIINNIPEGLKEADIRVYPNPARNRIFIRCPADIPCELIEVLSLNGARVDYIWELTYSDDIREVFLGNLPPGMYAMYFLLPEGPVFKHFIKADH